jgi:hypothetical protein
LSKHGLSFVHADAENLPDEAGMIEKRPTTVVYAKPCLTIVFINKMEGKLETRLFKMPPTRDWQMLPTLYEIDNFSHRLFNIQWQQGLRPTDYVLRYTNWEDRIQALIAAMQESVADMLSGDFSRWEAVSESIRTFRKKMGLDEPIEPTD